MSRCALGQAPGYWSGLEYKRTSGPAEWRLHPRPPRRQQAATACPDTLQRFLTFPQECAKRKGGICIETDPELFRQLENASILMLGDSTTTKLFSAVCERFGRGSRSFISVPEGTDRHKYQHKLRSQDHHVCNLQPKGKLPLGAFAHYGATGPPYWSFAYPLAPWLANNTLGQIRQDLPKFRNTLSGGGDPTLIVATSGYWDISARRRVKKQRRL